MYAPEVFHAILRHERARSDRDGGTFTLIAFDTSAIRPHPRILGPAVEAIRRNMRSIDEVGWIDGSRIGVLLPATNLTGARKFAERVAAPIPYEIYAYPAHWFSGADGGSGSRPTGRGRPGASCFEDVFGAIFCLKIPAWKRSMDIGGSLAAIAILSPVLALVSLYIKCVSPGPVLYRQKRVGYRGKEFTFLKFRTMHTDNDQSIHRQYLKELIRDGRPMEKLDGGRDPRIIIGGKLLRKSCIDELPQLFNVLKGDMSLVGPRPCIPYETEDYLRWHANRFDTLPGMTGLWQVSGKNKLSFEQMIRLDLSYLRRMSPWLDLKILVLTIPAIIGFVFEAVLNRIRSRRRGPDSAPFVELGREDSIRNA